MAVAMVASSVIGGLFASSAASDANDTNQQAIAGQRADAAKQQQLAQDQWDFQKNTYLPKQMANADSQLAMSKQLTDQQVKNSDYQMGLSKEQNTQAKKSYEFQDQYDQTARDYSNGSIGNAEAGRANADVQQSYDNAQGSVQRTQSRMGINPGSGASAAAMGDMYTNKMLAGAGAQTNARLAARNKAETMVAVAAGSGNAGFGTGAASGALANGSINGASGTNNTSLNGMNSVANTYGNGLSDASKGFGQSAASWNSAAQTANANTSFSGAIAGLGNSAAKMYNSDTMGGYSGSALQGAIGTGLAMANGSYNSNYGNEGRNYPAPQP